MQLITVCASALLAANMVFASPYSKQHMARHHAIAARAPEPVPVAVVGEPASGLVKRQSAGRKCRASSSTASSTAAAVSATAPAVVNVAPVPAAPTTTQAAPAPAPTTPQPAPPVQPAPPANTPSTNTGSGGAAPNNFMAGTNLGDGTYYDAGLGACGITNSDDQMFAAIAHAAFDGYPGAGANPNLNPICNKRVRVTFGGNTITIPITDRCGGCDNQASLDFSKAAFAALTNGNFGLGRVHEVSWTWA